MGTRFPRLHRRIAWTAGVAAILWALSGFSHPLMVWSTPRPATMAPPPVPALDLAGARPAGEIAAAAGMAQLVEVRALAVGDSAAWLLRESADSPRRWFDAFTGGEIYGHDRLRAERMARHYTGRRDPNIVSARHVAAFDSGYREVNRLLPVHEIVFPGEEGLRVYIDTATGRLAAMANDRQSALAFLFTNIHTMAFFPAALEPLRVALIAGLVGSLWLAALFGLGLLVTARSGRGRRRLHRLLGWIAVVPALMASSSGLYHLVHSSLSGGLPAAGNSSVAPAALTADIGTLWPAMAESRKVVALVAVSTPDAGVLWRLALDLPAPAAGGGHEHHAIPPPRGPEGSLRAVAATPALWFDSAGVPLAGGDEAVARRIAAGHADPGAVAAAKAELVTAFDADYGFLNKRLPVWRLDTGRERLYVDTEAGLLAARRSAADGIEGRVFDTLHKWRFMDFIGLANRDRLLMGLMAVILATATLGWTLQLARRKRNFSERSKL